MKHLNKASWREINGEKYYFRSLMEYRYACLLEIMRKNGDIQNWEHEPQTFWFLEIKRGVRSYLPDFRVTENDGKVWYAEVKGYMDPKSVTKLKRMKKYYPEVEVRLITK